MCSLDWVYIDLKIKNPRKHILFNKNEIFVICDFVIWFCGQVYSFTKRTLSPLSAWPQRLRRRRLPDCTYCMSFQTRRPYFLYETMEIKACAHNSPIPEWLFVSFGRTESLKLQQPKIQKPLHSPRSEEVKDEESKQLATSCPKSLHYATLPLSCVFPQHLWALNAYARIYRHVWFPWWDAGEGWFSASISLRKVKWMLKKFTFQKPTISINHPKTQH